ncbi:MAG: response regulator, partial [Nitrospirae bacterium]
MVRTAGEFHADTATDGADGLEKVRSGGYDIIFTDLKMPRMNGLEFMEHLREVDPTIPVVVVTAHSHLDTALSAMREGASDFITKPFNF